MRRALPLLVLAFVLATPATGLAGSIRATLDKKNLRIGEAATMRIEVEGAFKGHPELTNIPVVSVSLIGQQTRTVIRRGRTQQSHTFTYRVVGRAVGKGTLGPAKLDVDGRQLRSEYFSLEVRPGSTGGSSSPSSGSSGSSKPAGSSTAKPGTPGGDYFATAALSRTRPYVGESFLYQVETASAVAQRGIEWEPPALSPLSLEPNIEVRQGDHQRVIDGRRYTVNTIDMPLFAIEPGPMALDPAQFTMAVVRSRGLLGRTEQVQFRSNRLDLEIRPLPAAGRPSGFSGAVGSYRVTASIDRKQLDAGETATLKIEVTGAGALRGETIQVEIPEEIRSYDEQPEIRTKLLEDRVESLAIYRKTLVPLIPGSYTIPAIEFSFFDPVSGTYRTDRTAPLSVGVGGSAVTDPAVVARSASLGRAKEAVEVLGIDILPLHTGQRVHKNRHLSLLEPWVLTSLALPLLGFLGLAGAARRQRFAGTQAGLERQRRSRGKAAVKEAARAARAGDQPATEAALKTYLECRLGARGAALGPEEAASVIEASGATPELAEGLTGLLRWLEAARYGGAPSEGLGKAISDWMSRCEESWR